MIIYLHGFNSNGNTNKYSLLKSMFPDIEIFSPSYDSSNLCSIDDMIIIISKKIENEKNVLFIGCSLGGYLAQYLAKFFNAKAILLNPCFNPKILLKRYLGENRMYNSKNKYIFTEESISFLEKYEILPNERGNTSMMIFTNKDDTIIPYKEVFNYYSNNRPVKIFNSGGHRFTNLENIKHTILKYYNSVM